MRLESRCRWSAILAAITAAALSTGVHAATHRNAGPLNDPGFFPLAVWLQNPANAARYRAAGFNLFVGLWQGPTDDQLKLLKAARMPVLCEQTAVGLAHRNDPTIVGWTQQDEPDNAQEVVDPKTGKSGWGGPAPPLEVVSRYRKMVAADPTRPVLLNLGQGVTNPAWIGRGSGARFDDYLTYVRGGDILSFDVYPVAGLEMPHPENYLWYVPQGVDRLRQWTRGKARVWNCLECTHIGDAHRRATPQQVKSEAWMALIHGSNGFIWFVHQFSPRFDEHALLDDPEMLRAVSQINHQITSLARVLNSRSANDALTVRSSDAPIDAMLKQRGRERFIFAAVMRNGSSTGTFRVRGLPGVRAVEVMGEHRNLQARNGSFTDRFEPFGVHLYRFR